MVPEHRAVHPVVACGGAENGDPRKEERIVTATVVFISVLCAVTYAAAILLLKRSYHYQVRPFQQLAVNAVFQVAIYGAIIQFAEFPDTIGSFLLPAVAAVLFLVAQTFTVLAIYHGDASVQTPIMGTKVVFVSFLNVVVLGTALSSDLWFGTVAAAFAVFLLGWSRPTGGKPLIVGVVFALLSSVCFAGVDIIVVRAARVLDPLFVAPAVMVTAGIAVLLATPFFPGRTFKLQRPAIPWLVTGSFLFIGQTVGFGLTLSYFGEPTVMNIGYSSRALWSLILVLLFGKIIGVSEAEMGVKTVVLRGVGAVAVIAAIVVVLT